MAEREPTACAKCAAYGCDGGTCACRCHDPAVADLSVRDAPEPAPPTCPSAIAYPDAADLPVVDALNTLREKPMHRSFKAKDEFMAALAVVETALADLEVTTTAMQGFRARAVAAEAERDTLRRMVYGHHQELAAIGGGPCICDVCRAVLAGEEPT